MSVIPPSDLLNPPPKGGHKPPRTGKAGTFRAITLISIMAMMAAHYAHWKVAGETVSPVEPSEAMQALELGIVNAGAVFFLLAIVSTLIFGRFFCGWGCHIVALQDFCAWLLKRMKIRPKPLRSRVLVWVPMLAAIHMFIEPTVRRLVGGGQAPQMVVRLTTDDFWATFPGFWISALTLVVCGFGAVYFLGAKGFCTYGCPYGAFFYQADRIAPGRIRVTDACEGCGQCTAVCSSNVRVHEEVAKFGQVVDAGCMKCMDCVSVCPNQALYFGFKAAPGVARGEFKKPERSYDYSWKEEVALAAVMIVGMYGWYQLFDAIPFLLAIGLSVIGAFSVVESGRAIGRQNARYQHLQLRRAGKLLGRGYLAVGACALYLVFLCYAGVQQYSVKVGTSLFDQSASLRANSGPEERVEPLALEARVHLERAASLSPFGIAEIEYKLGSIAEFMGSTGEAESRFRRALELNPKRWNTRLQLARLLVEKGDFEAAVTEFEVVAREPKDRMGEYWSVFGLALLRTNDLDAARSAFAKALARRPGDAESAINYGLLEAQSGRFDTAISVLRKAHAANPYHELLQLNFGLVLAQAGQLKEAEPLLADSVRKNPKLEGAWIALAQARNDLGQADAALLTSLDGLRANPQSAELLSDVLGRSPDRGSLETRVREMMAADPSWRPVLEAIVGEGRP